MHSRNAPGASIVTPLPHRRAPAVHPPGRGESYKANRGKGDGAFVGFDIETAKVRWEIPQVGPPEDSYSGVLSTAGGLNFFGKTGGGFATVDATTGKTLWHFETNQLWKASPMTYMLGGQQYVAIASGGNILTFKLPEP